MYVQAEKGVINAEACQILTMSFLRDTPPAKRRIQYLPPL